MSDVLISILQILGWTGLFFLGYLLLAFVVGTAKKDNSLIDRFYPGGFMLIAWSTLILKGTFDFRQIIITILVTIWGIRLGTYVTIRNWGKGEDKRYQNMRERWGDKVLINSLLRIYLFQGLIIFLVVSPVSYINVVDNPAIWWLDFIGIGVWVIGFYFETVGDYQLYVFLNNPENQGKVFDEGLWRYTQHPNYFGEVTQWWGIFLVATSVALKVYFPYGFITIIGPIIITYMIINVSGVRLLNKQFEGDSEYARYKRRTSQFIPLPPKKDKD
ncbi:MAG: Steroid 5-alpha reductase [Promethearchaeota archaeon]|nr:MAG: Steroid 5-alpha reductase [Candidatus Lokiarchaeota archaeon]